MSHHSRRPSSRHRAASQAARQQLAHQPGLPFAGLLSSQDITQALPADLAWRQRLFTPVITVWVFLSQILDPDHSCRQAVARFLAWLLARGRPACSAHTGAYCQARQRLPETTLPHLTRQTGSRLEQDSPRAWRWHRRRTRLADGSTLSMPDTVANQKECNGSTVAGFVMHKLLNGRSTNTLRCGPVLGVLNNKHFRSKPNQKDPF